MTAPKGWFVPLPQVDLPEQGLPVQRQPLGHRNSLSCLTGASQVTGVDRIHRNIRKALLQAGDLLPSQSGDRAVILAVNSFEIIALRLGMAD